MPTGVVEVNDLSSFVEMHIGHVSDPLRAIAKYYHSLCVP